MPSQFFGLNIAGSGLRAAMAAYNTTANNVANAETDGYSRQEVTQEASNPLRMYTRYGAAGSGVDTMSIDRVRDSFYDNRYRNNQSLLGQYSQKNYYNSLIEQYLDDNGTTGFSSLYTKMDAALESVLTSSGTTTTKMQYISSVQSLAEYFNDISSKLQSVQSDLNEEIKNATDSINSIAQSIATINQQINVVEMTGTTANDLRDKRDMLLDDLSKIVNIETKESKVVDVNDPSRDTGATRFQVYIAGGQSLVDMYDYKQLVCVARTGEESVNQNDIDGLYDIKWVSPTYREGVDDYLGDFDLDNANIGGTLQGMIEMRDGNNATYFHGQSSQWDATSKEITISTTADYLSDMAKCTLPGTGVITIGSRTYNYDNWEYNENGSYTFHLTEGQDFSRITKGKVDDCSVGSSVNYQGVPYYMAQMNEWIRNFSDTVNTIMTDGYTSTSENGVFVLTGNTSGSATSAQYSYDNLTTTTKGYYFLTGSNFAVNQTLIDDAGKLSTKQDKTEGESECANITAVRDALTKNNIFRGATASDFLDKVLGDISLNTSNSSTMEATYTSLANTISNQRLSVSGVDTDEEAEAMVRYSNAYTLSAKMISTLQEIYNRLILETGV